MSIKVYSKNLSFFKLFDLTLSYTSYLVYKDLISIASFNQLY